MTQEFHLPVAIGDRLTACRTAADVQAGRRTAAQVLEETLTAVARCEPEIRAFVHLDPEVARQQARAVDSLPRKDLLAGVTIGVKDVITTKDMPTGHGSVRYEGVRSGTDAAAVDTLRLAGAVILGKTVTTEFAATARGGATRNPRALSRTPGGSSSGSAAAVAAGMCAIGLGTQTGGSTIRPASFTGIWGWKPTWGAISREGAKLFAPSCDTIGFFARDAEDFALLADVFDLDPAPVPAMLEGLRLGLCRSPAWQRTAPEMRAALAQAAACLAACGAQVVEFDLPPDFDRLPEAHARITAREGRATFLNEVRAGGDTVHEEFRAMVGNRSNLSAATMRGAYGLADQCRTHFDEVTREVDLLITPSACGEPPAGLDWTGDSALNRIWTLLHVPVVSVPGLVAPSGLPLGISVVARRYEDRLAIATAALAGAAFGQVG